MKTPISALLTAALLTSVVGAQAPAAPPVTAPIATPVPVPLLPEPTVPTVPAVSTKVEKIDRTGKVTVTETRTASGAVPASTGVMLNFQNASLNDVLTYLSEAAGFVIVQEAPVSGTVNIMSRQPLNPDEAVDLLNTVLISKGYAAIRNGRILKIVNKRDAIKYDIPVNVGKEPASIPRKDVVVTHILPLRYGEAAKLVENLRPLLNESAVISANEGSNAILLTDTQTNIHRIATIIQALDTSVSALSTITVIPLKFADSKEVAAIVTQLFAPAQGQQQGGPGGGGGGRRGFPGFGFGGGAPGGQPGAGQSDARLAAARVVAVADEQSNSVIVSASEETIPAIREMINQIDMSSTDITETRIFRLLNADAVELAGTINSLYGNAAGTRATGQTGAVAGGNRQGANAGNRGGAAQGNRAGAGGAAGAGAPSERALLQSQVVAVGDPRTNSLLVTAAADSMTHIAEIIGRLDATSAKRQHVYTHSLQHADPETLANVLRGMLGQQTTNVNSGSSRLQDRSANGAAMSTDSFSSSGSGGRSTR